MNPASLFLDLNEGTRPVELRFDGRTLTLPEGQNLAAALLAAGVSAFRHTAVSGAERGPFCMMGACFDCLVEVDGVRRQACMMDVTEGMVVDRAHTGGRRG